jgi:tRNA uridine 5-carbamoylmethylation protein Kti12
MPPIIIALIGLPASGKSTFAQNLARKLREARFIVNIIDVDIFRREIMGDQFTPLMEQQVIAKKWENIDALLEKFSDSVLIIDDMHYLTGMRHAIKERAETLNGLYMAIFFATPMTKCLEWNLVRQNPVPEAVIENIQSKLDVPGKKYAWDMPAYIVNLIEKNIDNAVDEFFTVFQNERSKFLKSGFSTLKKDEPNNKSNSTRDNDLEQLSRQFVRAWRMGQLPYQLCDSLSKALGMNIVDRYLRDNHMQKISKFRRLCVKFLQKSNSRIHTVEEFAVAFLTFIQKNVKK